MDNFHNSCPPMMSDGRLFTDYRTNIRANEHNKYINNIVRDDDYRMFLQNNGEKILDTQWQNTVEQKTCWKNTRVHEYPSRMRYKWFALEKHNADEYFMNNKIRCDRPTNQDYRATHTRSQH